MSELYKTHTPLQRFRLEPVDADGGLGVFDYSATPPRLVGSDGGEPEDQSFHRDWAWVPVELNAVHEALTAENISLKALLKEAQWSGATYSARGNSYCVFCNELPHRGHASDCKLAAALNGTPQPSLREQALERQIKTEISDLEYVVSTLETGGSVDFNLPNCQSKLSSLRALLKTEGEKS